MCSSCGQRPSLGVNRPVAKLATEETWKKPEPPEPGAGKKGRKRKKKESSGAPMMLLVVGWTVIMAGLVFVANRYWRGSDPRTEEWAELAFDATLVQDRELLQEASAACQNVLNNLISHNTPEQIRPFVFNRTGTFSDIIRYYQSNTGTQIAGTTIELTGMSVIHLPDGPAIEGHWRTEDGRMIDAVFRREDGEWLVDWHHFARFSEHPWPLFLAGDGPDEAEFRLLVRQRLSRVAPGLDLDHLSLAFHEPRFARPHDPGAASPAFALDWDSPEAELLMAGFEQARNGDRPFGARLPVPETDDDMMRVRVVIRRIEADEEDGERRFEIIRVVACHWLQLDHPGVDVAVASAGYSPADSE